VLLCDADLGLNNVDVTTGVENLVTYDLIDVIEGRCRAKQATVRHPAYANLYVLTSSHSAPERYVSPQAIKVVLDALAPQFDYIIIDCPAGIEEGFHRAVATADEAIVVTEPRLSAIRDADKVVTLLKSYNLARVGLVVNKVRGDLLIAGESLAPKEIAELLKTPLLGVIPEAYAVYEGTLAQPHTAFALIANTVATGKCKLYDTTRAYRGFFGGIKRLLKRGL
jgi:septum site-determining protein MinD